MKNSKTSLYLSATLLLSFVSFQIGFAAATSNFSDVKEDDWYYSAVTDLTNYGMLQGYEDGTFRGANNVNRAEMAVMMARIVDLIKYKSCIDVENEKIYLEGDEIDYGTYSCTCSDGEIQMCTGETSN